MNIVKVAAKTRFFWHSNALDIVNVLNQFKIYNDDKAEEKAKYHTMESFDALRIIHGYDTIEEMLNDIK